LLFPVTGLKSCWKQPLRQGAGEGLVERDIADFAEGDAGDLDFDGNLRSSGC